MYIYTVTVSMEMSYTEEIYANSIEEAEEEADKIAENVDIDKFNIMDFDWNVK